MSVVTTQKYSFIVLSWKLIVIFLCSVNTVIYNDAIANESSNKKSQQNKNWSSRIGRSFGRDNNVSRANIDIDDTNQLSDDYSFLYFSTYGYAFGDFREGLYTGLSHQSTNYSHEKKYNYKLTTLTMGMDYYLNEWYFRLLAEQQNTTFNDEAYQSISSANFNLRTQFTAQTWLSLQYIYSHIKAKNALYNYTGGNKQQYSVAYYGKHFNQKHWVTYVLENNDRNNYETNTLFIDASPTRHTLTVGTSIYRLGIIELLINLSGRTSIYRIRNLFRTNKSGQRIDKLYTSNVIININMNKNWTIKINGYSYSNTSSIETYEYKRKVAALEIEWRM